MSVSDDEDDDGRTEFASLASHHPERDSPENIPLDEMFQAVDDGVELLSSEDGQKPRRNHLINVLLMSTSFFFTFSAFTALQNLLASLNQTGKTCLAVLYGLLMVSCFITPPLVQRLSPKKTMVLCLMAHCVFTAANYYPVEYSLVPACALLGLASAPLWTAQQTYLTSSALLHAAQRPGSIPDKVINQFTGLFFFIMPSTQVFGNLISSLIIQQGSDVSHRNESADFCNISTSDSDANTTGVSDSVRYTLLSVYLAFDVVAVLLCLFFVRPLTKSVSKYVARSWKDVCLATFRRMADRYMLLLMLIVVFLGLGKAYLAGEFTKHYISECVGIGWVGYVMIVFGVMAAGGSVLSSRLASHVGRVPVVVSAGALYLSLVMFLIFWTKVPDFSVIFVVSGLWGFADSIITTQLSAFFGVLFSLDQEPAFANYRLWQALGFCVSFAYGDALTDGAKLWILACMLVVAMLLYLLAEIKHRRERKLEV